MRAPLRLFDMKGVKIGAQTDRSPARTSTLHGPHDPGLGESLNDIDAPRPKRVGDNPSGTRLLERISGCWCRSRRIAISSGS